MKMIIKMQYHPCFKPAEYELTRGTDDKFHLKTLKSPGMGRLIDLFGPDEFIGDIVEISKDRLTIFEEVLVKKGFLSKRKVAVRKVIKEIAGRIIE